MGQWWKVFLVQLLLCCCCSEATNCTGSEVSCASGDRCIPIRYICDNDNDCTDASDEDALLCNAWKNSGCDKGEVMCNKRGSNTCTPITEYCLATNPPCEGDLDLRICHILETQLLRPLADIRLPHKNDLATNLNQSQQLANIFLHNVNQTISHPDCPTMFTLVGDQCLSAFTVGKVSWGEAREFCQVLGGDLLSFRNVSHYAAVIKHLQENQLTRDFWLGGRFINQTSSWTWLDGSPMEMGSPFWGVRRYDFCDPRNVTIPSLKISHEANNGACYHYVQAPEKTGKGACAALNYEHYLYILDDDCVLEKSPLCVHI